MKDPLEAYYHEGMIPPEGVQGEDLHQCSLSAPWWLEPIVYLIAGLIFGYAWGRFG
jgi:hypothetical protein